MQITNSKIVLRSILFLLLGVFGSITLQAQTDEDAIVGIWEMTDKSAKMEVFKSENKYQAKLLWGKDIINADGSSKKDIKNPDKRMHNRDIVGITYLTDLQYDDGEYDNGKIYNSANGKIYKCYVWIKKDVLHLRGYLGIRMLGQTTKWNRVK